MNKNLIAAIAALTTTASIASVSITGDYEGIAQDVTQALHHTHKT